MVLSSREHHVVSLLSRSTILYKLVALCDVFRSILLPSWDREGFKHILRESNVKSNGSASYGHFRTQDRSIDAQLDCFSEALW